MKYTKMLCWVRPHEKRELIKLIDKFPIIFVKNYDDFKLKIEDTDYLVVSLFFAHKYISNFSEILKNCQDIQILLDCNGQVFDDVVEAFTDAKKRYHNYTVDQIVEDFTIKA